MSLLVARRGSLTTPGAPSEPEPEPDWDPTELNGLIYWFDADAITGLSDDDPVSQWDDLSGADRHAVQGTGSKQPLYKTGVLNGLPVVRFDGSDDALQDAYDGSNQFSQPLTIFAVGRRQGATERQYLYDSGYTGSGQDGFRNILALRRSGNLSIYGGSSWMDDGAGDTDWHLFRVVLEGGSSQLFIDGQVVSLSGSTGGGSVRGLTLGANNGQNADFLEGDIAEWFAVEGSASARDAEEYLADKWGLTIASQKVVLDSMFGDLGATSNKWAFGALSSVSGNIYGAPFNVSTVLRIDPTTDTADTFGSGGTGRTGVIEASNGKLYSPPSDGGTTALEIDPDDDSLSTFGSVTSSHAWYDGALAGNGAIYCPPVASATAVLKIDPSGPSVSQLGTLSSSVSWGGAVLADNGNVYMPPRAAGTILKVDPSDDSVSQIGSGLTGTGRGWSGGVKDPVSGRIYFTPKNETRVLVLDPDDDSTYYITGLISGADKWAGAIAKDGLLFFFPRRAKYLLVVDPTDDTFNYATFDTSELGSNSNFGGWWVGAVEAGGAVYTIPFETTDVGKWTFPA